MRWLSGSGILALTLGVFLALGSALWVFQQRSRAIDGSIRELANVTMILGEQIDRSFQSLDLVQSSLIEAIEAQGFSDEDEFRQFYTTQEIHQLLASKISGLPQVDAITLISASGDLINFSRYWPIPRVNISDRDYFKALTNDTSVDRFISQPVQNRGTGTWTIYNARKLRSRDGRFLGLVLGAVELNYFTRFFESINLGKNSAISLFRDDGTLLARFPVVEKSVGQPVANSKIFGGILVSADHGVVQQKSNFDGYDRLIAARKVAHFPLVVTTTQTMSDVLSQWFSDTRIVLALSAILELMIALAWFLIRRAEKARASASRALTQRLESERERALAEAEILRLTEQAEATASLAIQNERFNSALENMSQGLAMFGPDEKLVICNQKYLNLYELSRSLGEPGTSYEEIVRAISERFLGRSIDVSRYIGSRLEQIKSGKPFEKAITTSGGRTVMTVHRPMPNGGWVSTHEDITEKRQAEDRILHMARHDVLTGLPNRLELRHQLEAALTERSSFSVLCLDLDGFKGINDTFGHLIGDRLLEEVGMRLRGITLSSQLIARVGGDEFVILDRSPNQPGSASDFAEKIISSLTEPFDVQGHQMTVRTSIGISCFPQDSHSGEDLLKFADLALYQAKAKGGAQCCFFQPDMNARMQSRRRLEEDLRRAIEREEFVLYFQPLVSLADYQVRGFEALVRWEHKERGLVPPNEFIPVCEERGLIGALGEWVLLRACKEAQKWPSHITVAVNLSPLQFHDGRLVDMVRRNLAASGLAAHRLELEITESVLLHNDESNVEALRALQGLGVKISLDDFGTGYSSLSYLRSFSFDKIKIDKSFVKEMPTRSDCAAIVRAVTELGSKLGMRTTAEGVETLDQLDRLKAEGCTEVQGYFFSPPRPASEITNMLGALGQSRMKLAG